jgi:hypothetical protein
MLPYQTNHENATKAPTKQTLRFTTMSVPAKEKHPQKPFLSRMSVRNNPIHHISVNDDLDANTTFEGIIDKLPE